MVTEMVADFVPSKILLSISSAVPWARVHTAETERDWCLCELSGKKHHITSSKMDPTLAVIRRKNVIIEGRWGGRLLGGKWEPNAMR